MIYDNIYKKTISNILPCNNFLSYKIKNLNRFLVRANFSFDR